MTKNFVLSLLPSLTLLCASLGYAGNFTFQFDATPDGTVTAPIVGTGTFTFTTDPGNGTFGLAAFGTTQFSFIFGTETFSEANILTPLNNLLLRISEASGVRYLNFGGSGGGPFNGSLDLINGFAANLSFQPGFGSLYFQDGSYGTYEATLDTVPEPATSMLLGAGLAVLAVLSRRGNSARSNRA